MYVKLLITKCRLTVRGMIEYTFLLKYARFDYTTIKQ